MTFRAGDVPIFETERLRLRGFRADDLDGFVAIYGDGEHARFVGGSKSRFDCWQKLQALAGHWQLFGWGRFAIEDKATGEFLGHCGPAIVSPGAAPEMNYALAPQAGGKGYATEAVGRALVYAYRDLGWKSAYSMIDPFNVGSRRVAERLGAAIEKTGVEMDDLVVDAWRYPAPEAFLSRFEAQMKEYS